MTMNSRMLSAAVLALGFVLTQVTPVLAVDTPLDKLVIEVKPGADGKPMVENAEKLKTVLVSDKTVPMVVNCTSVDCTKITASFAGEDVVMTKQDKSSASAQLKLKTIAGDNLLLSFDKVKLLM